MKSPTAVATPALRAADTPRAHGNAITRGFVGCAAAMRASLDTGRAVQLDSVSTIADGLAAPMAGDFNYEVVRRYVDDVVVIDDEVIRGAMSDLLFNAKLLAEPAGATATAAIITGALPLRRGERVAAIVSGGNVDAAKLIPLLDQRR